VNQVTAMISEEGESVGFTHPFNPKNAGGNVERWLIDCEHAMRDSLKHVLKMASDAYATAERTTWLLEWPGQVVICVGSMYWTVEVGDAISSGLLDNYAATCTEELMKVVEKVRRTTFFALGLSFRALRVSCGESRV
jgi:dynein heavy chain